MFGYKTVQKVEPGMRGFYRIDHTPYHAGIGISSSRIKKALVSYNHFMAPENEDTPALRLGRAIHVALLEPETFPRCYAVSPRFDRRFKDQKAAAEVWEASNRGKEILSADDMELVNSVSQAVQAHPFWAEVKPYDREVMAVAECPETGILRKCKMDMYGPMIVDLKTCEEASAKAFRRSVLSYFYHLSSAYYQDIVFDLTGARVPFVHIAVEKKTLGVAVHQLSEAYLEEGRKLYKAGLKRIAEWSKTVPKSAYGTGINLLQPTSSLFYNTTEILTDIALES